jgi:hypothetical protein
MIKLPPWWYPSKPDPIRWVRGVFLSYKQTRMKEGNMLTIPWETQSERDYICLHFYFHHVYFLNNWPFKIKFCLNYILIIYIIIINITRSWVFSPCTSLYIYKQRNSSPHSFFFSNFNFNIFYSIILGPNSMK